MVPIRATARVICFLAPLLPDGATCSANGGQLWLLRLGLFELLRPKESADDWVWIIDHTIQTGHGKLLMIVGIRRSHWNEQRLATLEEDPEASFALEHQDLSVFAIEHMESSNSQLVYEKLTQLSDATGIVPCSILSDQGADVRGGAQRFCEEKSDGPAMALHDISHGVANALKRQLRKDTEWERFLSEVTTAKKQIRQTPLAFLMPPDLKDKARWMNLDPLVQWMSRVSQFLQDPQAALEQEDVSLDLDLLERKMGWIRQFEAAIARWSRLMQVAGITLKYLRNHGYHRQAPQELKSLLEIFTPGPAEAMVEEILDFVTNQCDHLADHRLPASTEVLESLIGKGKQLMGRNKNGYTKSVLAIPAATMNLTSDTITQALETVPVKRLQEWVKTHLGTSMQALRQRLLPNRAAGTKTG